ncbi:MAG: MFS transporter, partial [Alphaproteobacteria bacterium]|nr:MFS transporter [Alphaproteobacteria bacterium]
MSVSAASPRRILAAAMVGTAVEYYDFYIYMTAATLVFAQLYFPSSRPDAAQFASFATFSVAFIARPLGAVVLGHFGDRIGRKSTLVTSLLLMGGSTFLIAFLPGYDAWGWWAPACLVALRFLQGFGLGGEWGGAVLLAVENAPPGHEARYGSMPQQGSPLGFIIANGLILAIAALMPDARFLRWGWRIPFAASAVMVAIGLWIRLKITETPAFAAAMQQRETVAVPLGSVLKHHWRKVLAGGVVATCTFMVFYVMSVFCLNYGTRTLGYSFKTFIGYQLLTIPLFSLMVIFSGWAADRRWSQAGMQKAGALAAILCGALMPLMFKGHELGLLVTYLALLSATMGLA